MVDDVHQVCVAEAGLAGHGEGFLLVVAVGALRALGVAPDQASRVGHEDFVLADTRGLHEEQGGAHVGGPCAVEEEGLLAEERQQVCGLGLAQLHGAQDAGDGDRRGALDVVVVGEVLGARGLEEREGVVGVEVLVLEEHVAAEDLHGGVHELLHKAVLAVVAAIHLGPRGRLLHLALLLHARVVWVVADLELGRVGVRDARVEDDGDGAVRVDPGAHRVQVELADGDAHAPGAQVAEA
mmetsp:Transcript_9903/g.33591  ORF Transcript_9903/g.33591 Transcript_9903/m.33591 type:complete len:239 (-) Transcript_9903:516-1232(-)